MRRAPPWQGGNRRVARALPLRHPKEIQMQLPHDSLVVVTDGKKMLFLPNEGDPEFPNLEVERKRETADTADRDQKTDSPGRSFSSVGSGRSAYQETDFHQLE